MGDIRIMEIEPDEIEEASRLLSEALIRTSFSSRVVGGQEEKHRRMMQSGFKSMLAKKPGAVIVAKDNGTMVGVMRMVEWPDCQNSVPQGFKKIPLLLLGGKAGRNFIHFRKIWKKHDPKKPHWHIDPIAVLPGRQGQGIGSRLLKYFCDHVDGRDQAAYLEADQLQNVRLYERFGFDVIEGEPIFDHNNWFLWRDPGYRNNQ